MNVHAYCQLSIDRTHDEGRKVLVLHVAVKCQERYEFCENTQSIWGRCCSLEELCKARGLLADDAEWGQMLSQAFGSGLM